MNSLLKTYRERVPNDPRSDEDLMLLFGEAHDKDGRYEGYPDFVEEYDQIKRASRPPVISEIGAGFKQGLGALESSAYGLAALAGDVVGAEDFRKNMLDRYRYAEEVNALEQPTVNRVEDVKGVGDAVRFGLAKTGELAPQVGEALLFGAAGALGGSAAEPGAGTVAGGAGGFLSGFIARQSARNALKALVDKGGELIADKAKRDLVKDQLERIAKREVLDSVDDATKALVESEAKSIAKRYGAMAANTANFFGQGSGAVFGSVADKPGVDPGDARTAAILGGIGSAIANAPLPIVVAQKLFPGVSHDVAQSYVQRLAKDAVQEVPVGASGEFLDELFQIASERYADPARRNTPLSDEEKSRLLNATVIGGMAGGITSPITAIPASKKPHDYHEGVEPYIAEVSPERRRQIEELKGRIADAQAQGSQGTPQDLAEFRTLTTSERSFYELAKARKPEEQGQVSRDATAPSEPSATGSTPAAVTPTATATQPADAAQAGVPISKEVIKNEGQETQQVGQKEQVLSAPPAEVTPSPGTTHADLASMTREEYAAHLAKNPEGPTRGQTAFYKSLTRRPELRGKPELNPSEEQQSIIYGRAKEIGKAMGVDPDVPWMAVGIGDSKTKNPDGSRSKMYITLKDVMRDWTAGNVMAYIESLRKYGFNGAVKTYGSESFNASKVLNNFDNIVTHAKSDSDIAIAEKAARDVFGDKATLDFGLDDKTSYGDHTSHTDLLASAAAKAFSTKQPIQLPRSRYVAPVNPERQAALRAAATVNVEPQGDPAFEAAKAKVEAARAKADPVQVVQKVEPTAAPAVTPPVQETVKAPEPAPIQAPVRPALTVTAGSVDIEGRGVAFESSRGKGGETGNIMQPAWFRTNGDESLLKLSEALTSEASPKDKNASKSVSHRVSYILDNQTGEVHGVSTYNNNGETRVTKFTDAVGLKSSNRIKSLSLAQVIKAQKNDGSKRFTVLGSAYTKDAGEYVHDVYPDLATWEADLAGPLDVWQGNVASKSSTMQEKLLKDRTVDQIDQEVVEVEEDAYEAGPLDLDDAEMASLIDFMPQFTTVVDLLDLVRRNVVPPEMKLLIGKIVQADRSFFARAEEIGIADTLKEYGYTIQEPKAKGKDAVNPAASGQVERGTTERPQDNVPATHGGVRPWPRGPEANLESGQNPTPQAERPGQLQGETGTERRNPEPDRAADQVRFTLPEPARDEGPNYDPVVKGQLQAIQEAALRAGIEARVIASEVTGGAYNPETRTAIVLIGTTIGRQDIKTALHEIAHDVFVNEAPDVKTRLVNAVRRLSDDALGLDTSADPRIRQGDPAKLGDLLLQEERLVDATAEKLTADGFNPEQAKGFAKSFVRRFKDVFIRAVLKVQRMFGMRESERLALEYFANRTRMLLSGDPVGESYQAWLGIGKQPKAHQHAQWYRRDGTEMSERLGRDGRTEYDRVPDFDLSSVRFNTHEEVPGYDNTIMVERQAAVMNHLKDALLSAGNALRNDSVLAKLMEASGQTADKFFAGLLGLTHPEFGIESLKKAGQEFDSGKRMGGFNGASNRDAVISGAYQNIQNLLAKAGAKKAKDEETISGLQKSYEQARERYGTARQNYLDWQYQSNEAIKAMRHEWKLLFNRLKGKSRRLGVIEQQLKDLVPNADLPAYTAAFENLLNGKSGVDDGKLFELLDHVANNPDIDFNDPASKIKDAMLAAYAKGAPYEPILVDTKQGQALLATVIAFGKTHRKVMIDLELRRAKDGKQRAAIEADIAKLADDKKTYLVDFRQLARTAKLEERARAAHAKALKDLRKFRDRIAAAEVRSKAIDLAFPAMLSEQSKLAGMLQIGANAVWGDGMIYNVPEKATSTSQEAAQARRELKLDSRGEVTDPKALEADLRKMALFLHERERQASEGKEDALDNTYQGIRRQFVEMAGNQVYRPGVMPAQRLMTELSLMPVGKRIAEGIGTPLARMVDQMINKFTDVMNEMRGDAERIGRRVTQLEDDLLRMLPGKDRDYLRDYVLNPAKRLMQRQYDLEELYAGDAPRLKRAIYGRLKEYLTSNPNTTRELRGSIDKFMPALEKLLEFQHDANTNFLLERVKRADTGVLDPKLKTYNPATGGAEPGVRRHLQVGAYTFSQKLGRNFGVMVGALRNSGWHTLGDALGEVLKAYQDEGADAARKIVDPFFNNAEHWDQVQNSFFRELANLDTESVFTAPALEDGITRPPADTKLVSEAYEASGGDVITFAENLYDLYGGEPEGKAQYVVDVLSRLSEVFNEVDGIYSKVEPSGASERITGIRGMTGDALIDARSIEHLPGQWFDYHSFDRRDMSKMVERIASQTAFGRGQERLASAFETLGREVQEAQRKLTEATIAIRRANPVATKKDVEAGLKKQFGADYEKLKAQADRARLVVGSEKELSDFFRKDNNQDASLNAIVRISQSIGNLLVNNPSSAIYQLAALYDINTKYGAGGSAVKATLKTIGQAGKEIAASLAQALGIQMFNTGSYHKLFVDLGLNDPGAVAKFRDAFDKLEGEGRATSIFRGLNDLTGVGLNRLGEKAEHPVLRPLQPFITSAMAANKALTEGMWQLVGTQVMKGMEFYKSNQDALADSGFTLTSAKLKLKGLEKDTFDRLIQDLERWGMSYDAMVRSAFDRKDNTPFTDAEAMRIYSMMMAEVSSEASLSTMPLSAYNNSIIRFVAPLLGWAFRRMNQVSSLRLNTEGQNDMRALAKGMAGLSIAALGGLAVSALVDKYYEEILGKERNLRPLLGAPDAKQFALGVMENLNRVGTIGLFGELINGAVNVGQGADNRMFSLDKRVVALSAFGTIQQAMSAWLHQGFEADYVHVVRPLASAMGANGLLQYMQIANRALGLDTAEGRVTARINAQNYLRVVGRQLELDVRQFGSGGYSAPTPMTPYLTRMELAAYANDRGEFMRARDEAIRKAKEEGYPDPVDHVKRAFSAKHPLRSVFRTTPSSAEYKRILGQLPDDGRRDVGEAVRLFNLFGDMIGIKEFEGRSEKQGTIPALRVNTLRAMSTGMRQ